MLQIGLFIFFKNELLRVGFHDMFLSSSQLHSYNTRNAMNYRSQFSRTHFRKPSLLNSKTNLVFKKNLHRFLVQQANLS